MNAAQRKLHRRAWYLIAAILLGVFGAALIVRERVSEALSNQRVASGRA